MQDAQWVKSRQEEEEEEKKKKKARRQQEKSSISASTNLTKRTAKHQPPC
jgi:hypothetical protein